MADLAANFIPFIILPLFATLAEFRRMVPISVDAKRCAAFGTGGLIPLSRLPFLTRFAQFRRMIPVLVHPD
jgi:hypothetical protein